MCVYNLLTCLFFPFFCLLLELVADQGVEERDDEVEKHCGDAVLPQRLYQRLLALLGVQLLLRLEERLFLLFDGVSYRFGQTGGEIAHKGQDALHHVLGEGYDEEADLDGHLVDSFTKQTWQEEGHEGNLEVAAHEAGEVEQWIRNLDTIKWFVS